VTDESEVFYVREKLDRQVLSAETVAEHADNGQAHREHVERRLGHNGANSTPAIAADSDLSRSATLSPSRFEKATDPAIVWIYSPLTRSPANIAENGVFPRPTGSLNMKITEIAAYLKKAAADMHAFAGKNDDMGSSK
jgi:hypothetical protein